MTEPRRGIPVRFALVSLGVTVAAGLLLHLVFSRHLIREAEERVQNVLLTQRGIHRFFQEVMHPEFYRAQAAGEISASYYAPELLSSSHMVRSMHALYNEERVKAGLEPMYYRLASENPRNPVNLADERERTLLRLFNQDRTLRDHREIRSDGGSQYLEYAIPFLETNPSCLRCHGARSGAPAGVTGRYQGEGGFNEAAGQIRAIESIRVPILGELRLAWTLTGAVTAGLLFFFGLVLFNGRLRTSVRERTQTLRAEVAERRRAEVEVVQLKDSLSAVIDAMPSVLVGLDGQGRVTLWNRQAEHRTGLTADQARARPVAEVLPDLAPHLESLRRDEAGATGPVARENVAVGTGERRRYYDLLHYPLSVRGLRGGVLRVEDVTARVDQDAHQAEAQKLEAIGTLAGGVAHDFNNILSAISGYAELAMGQASEPCLREDLQAIREAVQRANDLTRQILSFSRQGPQEPRVIQPAAIVREALKLLRATIPATVEIRTRLESEATVLADPGDLHRVVVNLCTNAALAMRDGGRLDLELDEVEMGPLLPATPPAGPPGRSLRLTVRDTGVGMKPEVRARIFEPFFTTRGGQGGSGMGLAVVHGIARRLGGSISVVSAPGAGTTFQVFLPVTTQQADPLPGPVAAAPRGSERVLFLDDEPALCRVAERSLTQLGYQVTTFTSPVEALAAFAATPEAFDLVVTDMNMPGLSGEAVAQRLKASRPDIPVILCTGFSEGMDAERAARLGIARLVIKPAVGAQLSGIIRDVLKGRAPPADQPATASDS